MNTQEMLDAKCWAEQIFGNVQLHDVRRTRRAVKAAMNLVENPLGSLPAQMQTWKETKALYRLLDEPEVTFAALIQSHLQQTREQANASPVMLLVQDTTDIDWLCCKKLRRSPGRMKSRHLLHLGNHSKQAGDEGYLTFDVPFGDIVDLSFVYHAHDLITLKRSLSRFKRKEAHPWFDQSFDEAMVLFNQIVEVFYLPQFHVLRQDSSSFDLGNRFGVGRIFVHIDDPRC
jgi:hypothetical protein